MKTKNLTTLLLVGIVTIITVSCSESINGIDENASLVTVEKSSEFATIAGDSCTFTGTLTETDVEGLMEMREEEKLARDVYTYFYEIHDLKLFSNISRSETAHTNAVLYLIEGYGLTDPTPESAAEFNDPLFSDLYSKLTSQGSEGLVEALKTGAFIEEYDIADLEKLIDITQNVDIIRVYSNLLRGSKNHLSSFVSVLKQMGETYTPTVITEAEYQEILAESGSIGRNGNNSKSPGVGNGYRNGYGYQGSGMGNGYGNNKSNGFGKKF